jgi:aminopeptidase-like protein
MGRFKLSSSDTRFASELLSELFPICRSITGDGVRESLAILDRKMKLNVQEIPSGTKVFDWTIPKEWNIRDAYIADPNGKRVVDFKKNNLHVMSYSTPVKLDLSFDQLQPHLYTLPNLPEAVPYRTSYFKEDWAFCLTQHQFDQINRDFNYEVVIDADLKDGNLTLADTKLSGSGDKKYLISAYCCHPSMANDNLSGLIVASLLYQKLEKKELRHNYLFVILPETIGAITYLSKHQDEMKNIDGGFVITTCGGPGPYGHKETYLGNHAVDRAIRLAFRDASQNLINYPFVPDGSDERQYSSPGFRIPVATITKDKYYEYPYYHTSLDNLDFVKGETLAKTANLYMEAINILEKNKMVSSLNPNCEAQLGRRGLYPATGGEINQSAANNHNNQISNQVDIISWIMFMADGEHDLISIAERSGHNFKNVSEMADRLIQEALLDVIE